MFLFSQHRNWAVAGAGQSWAAGLNKSISDGLVAGGEGGMRAPDIRAVEQWTGLVIYPDLEIAQLPPAAAAGNRATKRRHQHHHNNTSNSNSSHPRLATNMLVNTRHPRHTRQLSEYLKFHHFFAAYQREK